MTQSSPKPEPALASFKYSEDATRKALLLRVGIDRGAGGALGPIFPDGTFEYVPIPEEAATRSTLTYATLPGRHRRSLAAVLPLRLAARVPHVDPDFALVTYGDAAPRKCRQLLRLRPGDLLAFYAGLAPRPAEDRPRLFAIGYLTVQHVHDLRSRDLDRPDLQRRFGRTAHFLRRPRDRHLALVEGKPGASKLLVRAVPLGDGHDRLLHDLEAIGYRGSLLRAVGHWIRTTAGLSLLEAWLGEGAACLVQSDNCITLVTWIHPPTAQGADIGVDGGKMREGDWIIALCATEPKRVQALARVNRLVRAQGRSRAFCSLYWCFPAGDGPMLHSAIVRALRRDRAIRDIPAIRRVVTQVERHHRIGLHLRRIPGRGRDGE